MGTMYRERVTMVRDADGGWSEGDGGWWAVQCDRCRTEDGFAGLARIEADAEERAKARGWTRDGATYLCPLCSEGAAEHYRRTPV